MLNRHPPKEQCSIQIFSQTSFDVDLRTIGHYRDHNTSSGARMTSTPREDDGFYLQIAIYTGNVSEEFDCHSAHLFRAPSEGTAGAARCSRCAAPATSTSVAKKEMIRPKLQRRGRRRLIKLHLSQGMELPRQPNTSVPNTCELQ